MRRFLLICAAVAIAAFAGTAQAREVIDRIVAVIDHRFIVTASDIRKERTLLTAIGETAPEDRVILQQLIDRRLVEDQVAQIAQNPAFDVTETELEAELSKLQNPLAASLPEVQAYVRTRLRLARYEDRRFRQFIRVTAEEKQQYYKNVFLPEAQRKGLDPLPQLEDPEIDAWIEVTLSQEKVDREVANVMEALRARNDVETFLP